jgi:DNA-binding transcriptional MerR regulator
MLPPREFGLIEAVLKSATLTSTWESGNEEHTASDQSNCANAYDSIHGNLLVWSVLQNVALRRMLTLKVGKGTFQSSDEGLPFVRFSTSMSENIYSASERMCGLPRLLVDNKYCKCYNKSVLPELEQYRESTYSLEGLVRMVQGILERTQSAQPDARVAEIPDARTLRYYQTTGLMDKPLRYEGRRAIYGYRHLLQALSIKLLQGQGYRLTQIQGALSSADRATLERVVVERMGEDIPPEVGLQSETGAPPLISFFPTRRGGLQGQPLIAAEVGRGVTVMFDPKQVEEPEVLLVAMRELLHAIREEG